MATILTMPGISAGSESAQILSWLKSEGEEVSIDEPILEIETDKAVVEVTAEQNGKLAKILVPAGEVVQVGSAIGVLLEKNEGAVELANIIKELPVQSEKKDEAGDINVKDTEIPAPEHSGKQGGRVFASPLARRMAREVNLDLANISGSGPHNRIIKRDVLKALKSVGIGNDYIDSSQKINDVVIQDVNYVDVIAVPHTGMRRTIASRLTESKQNVPHFYLKAVCKVDALMQLRKQINSAPNIKVSINDLIVKAVALALQEVPAMNVTWTADAMLKHQSVDISVAVSTDTGLITPVVKNANNITISKLSDRIKQLAKRARKGGLTKEEYTGGSFTVSNLGMYGTKEFSAIINPPQSAILAVGCAKKEPLVQGDSIVIAQTIDVTLSVDHRAIDGSIAAHWLEIFKNIIENPFSILI